MGKRPKIIDAEFTVVGHKPPPEPPYWAWGEPPGGGIGSLVRIVVKGALLIAFVIAARLFLQQFF